MINKETFLVKAKRVDNGEWIEGYLYVYSRVNKYVIYRYEKDVNIESVSHEIDPTTICRFTGLYKNNQKVWENDIVKYHFGEDMAVIKFGKYQNCFDSQKACHCGFYVDWQGCYLRKDLGYWIEMLDDSNIVGNIFDNPEILEKQQKKQS